MKKIAHNYLSESVKENQSYLIKKQDFSPKRNNYEDIPKWI